MINATNQATRMEVLQRERRMHPTAAQTLDRCLIAALVPFVSDEDWEIALDVALRERNADLEWDQ